MSKPHDPPIVNESNESETSAAPEEDVALSSAAAPVLMSPSRMLRSQRLVQLSQAFNAIAYACLADHVLTLYALKLGADAPYVGLLSSLVYLTMFWGLLGKRMVALRGPVTVYGMSWFLRYILAAIMVIAPFALEAEHSDTALIVLFIGALLFFSFRAIGNNAQTLLLARITTSRNRGRLIAGQFTIFYLGSMFVLLAYGLLLGDEAPLWRFQLFMLFGVITGAVSGLTILRIPEIRDADPRDSAPIKSMFKFFWQSLPLRRFLVAGIIARATIAATLPFMVVSLRQGMGLPEDRILLLVIFLSIGNVIASFLNRMYLDRLGARPLMMIYSICLLISLAAWIAVPGPNMLYIAATFLISGLVYPGYTSAQFPYLFNIAGYREQYSASLFSEIAMGLAGFAGAFLGGGLIGALQSLTNESILKVGLLKDLPWEGFTPFRWYFALLAVAAVIAFIATQRIPRMRDRRFREVLNILLSPRDLQALFYLGNLTGRLTEEEESEVLDRIGGLGSPLSERELLEGLSSPRMMVRADALHALETVPPTPAIIQGLINELKNNEFTTAYLAAELLGIHGVTDAISLLRRALSSTDLMLQSKAILSLGRLRDEQSYGEILAIFRSTQNPRLLIHCMNAFGFFGKAESVNEILRRLPDFRSHTVLGEAYLSIATLCETGKDFYSDYKAFLQEPQIGISILQDLAERPNEQREVLLNVVRAFSSDSTHFAEALTTLCRKLPCRERSRLILNYFITYLQRPDVTFDPELKFCLAYCCLAMALREKVTKPSSGGA